jgi:hypothetical protein
VPKESPTLIYTIKERKINICNYILDNFKNINVNIVSKNQFTPLIAAILKDENKIAIKLISKGANINYSGSENKYVPLSLCFTRGLIDVAEKILEYDVDYNKHDTLLETPIYYIIRYVNFNLNIYNDTKSSLKSMLEKMIKNSDLLNVNIDNRTPFHLLVKYNMWQDFKQILIDKKFDMNAMDKYKNTPFSELSELNVSDFVDFTDDVIKKGKDTYILYKKPEIFLPDIINNNTEFGLFNSDGIHCMMYLVYLLKKYDNVSIPIQCPHYEKKIWDDKKLQIISNNSLVELMNNIVLFYNNTFYTIMPHILFWANKNIYFRHSDMTIYLSRAIKSKKHRFVLLKLTLIPNKNTLHANIVIYDKNKNIIIRFEPYGDWEFSDSYFLDKKIIDIFKKAIDKKHHKTLKYLRPTDYLDKTKFQSVSLGDDTLHKNLGDPAGYCLAWCYWFIELKIKNPELDERKLVEDALNNIILKSDINNTNPLLSHIRGYARHLDNEKNILLKNMGINKHDYYKLSYTSENISLFENLVTTFTITHLLH